MEESETWSYRLLLLLGVKRPTENEGEAAVFLSERCKKPNIEDIK
jgi:hypothetical protein